MTKLVEYFHRQFYILHKSSVNCLRCVIQKDYKVAIDRFWTFLVNSFYLNDFISINYPRLRTLYVSVVWTALDHRLRIQNVSTCKNNNTLLYTLGACIVFRFSIFYHLVHLAISSRNAVKTCCLTDDKSLGYIDKIFQLEIFDTKFFILVLFLINFMSLVYYFLSILINNRYEYFTTTDKRSKSIW